MHISLNIVLFFFNTNFSNKNLYFFSRDACEASWGGLAGPGAFSHRPRMFECPYASQGLCASCGWRKVASPRPFNTH